MSRSRAIRRMEEGGVKKAPVLSPKELKRLLFVAGDTRNPERNQLIVWLLFGAGFRITEVALVEIKDVLWESGSIRNEVVIPAKHCKNGKAGHVYFYHKKLIKALEAYLEMRVSKRLMMNPESTEAYRGLRKDSKLILSENKRPYSLKRKVRKLKNGTRVDHWACDTLQAMVATWGREAGIEDFSTHSGRRTFATILANKGVSEELLCALLRRSSEKMVHSYLDPNFKLIKKTVESMYTFPETYYPAEMD